MAMFFGNNFKGVQNGSIIYSLNQSTKADDYKTVRPQIPNFK